MKNTKQNLVVGSGFVAKNFKKVLKKKTFKDLVIYASGISNSRIKDRFLLKKEIHKIKSFLKHNKKMIIYISTYSVLDPSRNKSLYCKNKIKIEKFIKKNAKNYQIIRFPELVGKSKNPNTLTNYFYKKIKNKKNFILFKNAIRNFLDVDHAIKLSLIFIQDIKYKNKIINLINPKNETAKKVVFNLEKIIKKKARYVINKKNFKYRKILSSVKKKDLRKIKIKFDNNYLFKILKKYYN